LQLLSDIYDSCDTVPILPCSPLSTFQPEAGQDSNDAITLSSHPRRFKQLLEAALLNSELLTTPEIEAKGSAA
jgi:hypothetical protein